MKKLFLLSVILLFTAATYGPPFSVSDFSSLTNRPNPSAVNPVGVVLGKTNAYDGNGGIFVFTPSSTNAVDGDIYLSTTTTGRWVRLTRDLATIQSPLVLSNGTLSLAALTNYFTFLAGTNMQVTVTSNTVTYAMTNTVGSGNRITVNGGLVTNFWDNGYITFLDAGGGDYSLNIGNDTISTNKINSTFYNWVLSLAGAGGGTTNGLGVNGTFRTDWNAISSAEIAYTVSAGTNWYGSLVAGSVGANKLATTGTGTSTNFLAGDFAYKQVTTNMIPGLNAILATIGTGGSGGESNTASNLGTPSATNQGWYASKSGVDLQFRSLQVGPNLTLTSNANSIRLDVTLSTNSGTVVSVDGGSSLATVNFADTTGIGVTLSTTNASFALVDRDFGDLTVSSSGTVMTIDNNVITSNKVAAANITQDKLGTSGTGLSTNFLAGDYNYKQVTTNMIPGLNAILATIGTGGSGGGTNIKVNGTLANLISSSNALFNVSGSDISLTITNVPGTTTDNVLQWLGSAYFVVTNNSTIGDFSTLQTNGIVYNATIVGPGENDAPLVVELSFPSRSTNYIWTFRPEGDVNGFVAYEAEGYRTTTSIRFKLHEAVGSTFFTGGYWMRFDLYDKANVGGSGSGLTEAQASLLYQRTNSTLTRIAGIGAGSQGDIIYRDANGWTNFAKGSTGQFLAATSTGLAFSNAPSGLTDGGTIGSGTITRFTTTTINSLDYYNIENGDSFCDGDQWTGSAFIFFPTYVGSALASGTVDGIAATTNNPSYSSLAASASANSGWAYLTDASAIDIGGGGHRHFSTVSVAATNNIVYRSGFFDSATAPVDGAYIRMVNGFAQGVLVNNSSETVTTSSNQMSISSTTFVRFVSQVNTDAASCTFFVLTPSTPGTWTTNWTASVTNTLPTGSSRLTGFGFAAYHTSGSSGTVIARLDNLSKRTLRILNR